MTTTFPRISFNLTWTFYLTHKENLFLWNERWLFDVEEGARKIFYLETFFLLCIKRETNKKENPTFLSFITFCSFFLPSSLMLIQPLLLHPLYPFLFKTSIIHKRELKCHKNGNDPNHCFMSLVFYSTKKIFYFQHGNSLDNVFKNNK